VNVRISSDELERFRSLVSRRLGLWFDDGKLEYLANILEQRLRTIGEPAQAYLARFDAPLHPEHREIAQEVTVGETYFFRHSDQFRAFADVALPARLEARGSVKRLRILSAGCSSGEEAYSLSILTQQRLPDASWQVAIKGIDINPRALARARLGRYSSWALRETPEDIQKRHFTTDGREYILAEAIRDSVAFEEDNLAGDESWGAGTCDVVFCRNVLMYFAQETAHRVIKRLSRALAPGGYLFLGHAENLRGLSLDFDLCHTHDTFYYCRKEELGRAFIPLPAAASAVTAPSVPLSIDWASSWLETVQRSSDRIRELTEKAPTRTVAPRPAAPLAAAFDLGLALELLAQERFAEALEVLNRLPPSSAQDADTVLLRAALLTHSDRLDAAELACAELLTLDRLNAGAHYLRALCRERRGDTAAAIEHAQAASYLEPSFAMPHLHLGLMARRTGDRDKAQRELSQAAVLLQREDSSRLLLFGGGFNRDGLIALCHSELERLGGAT